MTNLNFDFDFDDSFVFTMNNRFLCYIFIACNCYASGSQSASCASNSGKCTCNAGYDGQRCSQCAKGFYKILHNSQDLCLGINPLVEFICFSWLRWISNFYR